MCCVRRSKKYPPRSRPCPMEVEAEAAVDMAVEVEVDDMVEEGEVAMGEEEVEGVTNSF